MSYCTSSFYFVQEALLEAPKMSWKEVQQYACGHPVKFVGLATFLALGGVPIATFLVYAVCTIIASVIGAIVAALVLLAVGITVLGFTLFFVGCATAGVVSMFSAVYFGYRFATCTVKKAWPTSNRQYTFSETETEADKNQ